MFTNNGTRVMTRNFNRTCTSVRVSLLNENSFTFQRNNCCALFIQLDLQSVFLKVQEPK